MLKFRNMTKMHRKNLGSFPHNKVVSFKQAVRRAAMLNPELPLAFIRDCLMAKKESSQGKLLPFNFQSSFR